MSFVKPTAEQIEKILQSDKSFRFLHDIGKTEYTLSKYNEAGDYIVTWSTGIIVYNTRGTEDRLGKYWSFAEEDLAQLEDTSKRHKHYDIIKQWIEDPNSYEVYYSHNDSGYYNSVNNPNWNPEFTYRLEKKKPKVKKYKVLFQYLQSFCVSGDYYKDEEDFSKQYPQYKFIQLIQESEKEF